MNTENEWVTIFGIQRQCDSDFKSDREAMERVIENHARNWADWNSNILFKTCQKAIMLCCNGGNE